MPNRQLPSPLKRMGGKGHLYPWIIAHIPIHRCFVEVFAAAAAVLLNKMRCSGLEIYNDLDAMFCNTMQIIRDRPDDLAAALATTPYSRKEFEAACHALKQGPIAVEPLEWARLHFVILRQSFSADGGSWSTSSPHGKDQAAIWGRLPEEVARFAERMQGVHIEQRDFRFILKRYDEPTVAFYCDPPYFGVEDAYYDANRADGFDHEALRAAVENLKGSVLISYNDRPQIRELYEGWRFVKKSVIVRSGSTSRPDTELLIMPNKDWKKLGRKRMQDLYDDDGNPLRLD